MVFTRPGTVEMLDVDWPSPGVEETVVRVAAAGICGSELHGIATTGWRTPPLVMGHEFAGATPDGRRVTVNPILACGKCDLCLAGSDHLCRDRSIVGIHRSGGFADEVVVPLRAIHDIPADLSWMRGAMVEPLANAVHAWRLAGEPRGGRVGIFGAGTIGLVALLVARRYATDVHVADLSEDRRSLAAALGATRTGSTLEGEFDIVIDAVGAATTRRASLVHSRPGGTAVWIGLLSPDSAIDAAGLIRNEKTIRGSFAYTSRDFTDAIELARTVDLDWATDVSLEDGARVFTELMNGRTDIVKAVLRPSHLPGHAQ